MTEELAKSHPGVLAGTHHCRRDRSRPGGWTVKSRAVSREARARYEASEEGRAARARYEASEKGRINKILRDMRYNNKLADARDAAQLQALKERRGEITKD